MAQENITLQEQMRYNRLSMQATTESYNAQRSLTHDFEHHMLTMVHLLQIGQMQFSIKNTEKEKESEHGYGLKTCKKILQRSHFDSAMQYQDGWFQFTAIKAL